MSFNEHLKLFLAVLLHELQVLVFEIILHVIIENYFSICVFKTISFFQHLYTGYSCMV